MSERKVSDDDLAMLKWFQQERGDMTRDANFEKMLPDLEREQPALIMAWRNYLAAKEIFNAIVDRLP